MILIGRWIVFLADVTYRAARAAWQSEYHDLIVRLLVGATALACLGIIVYCIGLLVFKGAIR